MMVLYNATRNSQKENTPTCVLTIGDSRKLYMRAHRINDDGHNVVVEECNPEESKHVASVELKHGDLFVLLPADEVPKRRPLVDASYKTFFKHGGVDFGGDDKFSVGLAFRVSTISQLVSNRSGRMILSKKERNSALIKQSQFHLSAYIANKTKWKKDDDRRTFLWRKSRDTHFKW